LVAVLDLAGAVGGGLGRAGVGPQGGGQEALVCGGSRFPADRPDLRQRGNRRPAWPASPVRPASLSVGTSQRAVVPVARRLVVRRCATGQPPPSACGGLPALRPAGAL